MWELYKYLQYLCKDPLVKGKVNNNAEKALEVLIAMPELIAVARCFNRTHSVY